MKKLLLGISVVCVLVLSGCAEERRVARETHTMTTIFAAQVKAGKTSREQEQKFIYAMKDVTATLDASIRGTAASAQTTKDAEAMAQGIDVTVPINIDK